MVAFDNNVLVGYLFAVVRIDNRIGRGVLVPYEGLAIRDDQSSELIRVLYAKVFGFWLEQGCFQHSVLYY